MTPGPGSSGTRSTAVARTGELHTSVNGNGYIHLSIKGKLLLAHRVIWCLMNGEWPDYTVDHNNTVRTDNRWENLREATETDQGANRGATRQNALGIKGVRKRGKRYTPSSTSRGR